MSLKSLCVGLSVLSMLLLHPSFSPAASKQSNCATQALQAAANYFEVEGSGIVSTSPGSTMLNLIETARNIGLDVTGIQFTQEDLVVLTQPFIAHFSEGHFVFVKSLDQERVHMVDNGQETTMDIKQFKQRCSGNAVIFKRIRL